jgi:predicted nucleotidyltransferase
MERQRLIRRLLAALHPYQAERIYLFGSCAREEEDEFSDLDVVIIKPTAHSFFERLRQVGRLLPADLGAVDILVYTPEEFAAMLAQGNAFAEMIVEEGRLLYDQQTEG